MTSGNLISHVRKVRKFVIAILHRKQGLLCDNYGSIKKKKKTQNNFLIWRYTLQRSQPIIVFVLKRVEEDNREKCLQPTSLFGYL